jgi:hypothetical protein
MKQGSGHTSVSAEKSNYQSKAVNPAHVAQMGTALGNHATGNGQILPGASVPLYRGRGLEAPMVSCESSNCGSQGKHR